MGLDKNRSFIEIITIPTPPIDLRHSNAFFTQ
jgi:hypothetical protein